MGPFARPVKPSTPKATASNGDQTSPGDRDWPPSALGDVVADVGSKVQEILDSTARAAAQIRAEADAAGAAYLEDCRRQADALVAESVQEITRRTEALRAQVEVSQREAAALVEALDQAQDQLIALTIPPHPTPVPPAATPAPVPDLEGGPAPAAAPAQLPEQAALRATQMAVAGAARHEIEDVLRNEFAVDDPVGVVDKILRTERV